MVRRILLYTIIGVFICGSFLFSISTGYLKKPLTGQDNVVIHMAGLEKALNSGKWNEASRELKALKIAWRSVRTRVQLTWDLETVRDFDTQLAKLTNDIQSKNRSQARDNLTLLQSIWREIGDL